MSVILINIVFLAMQMYLFIKLNRYIKSVFNEKYQKTLLFSAVVFFVWMFLPLVYVLIYGVDPGPYPAWKLYGFVYPFYGWTLAVLMLVILFLIKDIPISLVYIFKRVKNLFKKTEKSITEDQVVNWDRRRILKAASAGIVIPPLAIVSYGITLGTSTIYKNKFELHFPNLPENLRGMKIAQFSDIHCSPFTPKEDIAKAVKFINEEKSDIVFLTGDYVPTNSKFIYPCIEALKELRGKLGVYATMGNHEHWTNLPLIKKVIEENGIPVYHNQGRTFEMNGEKFNLLGVDDSKWGYADIDLAFRGVEDKRLFNIMMSHEPDYWDEVAKKNIDLTLAGHTHGGQITLNLLGSEVGFGNVWHNYNKGLFDNADKKLFVSTGFGFTGPPVRVNNPPEIVIITLT